MSWSELLDASWKGFFALVGAGGGGALIALGIFKFAGQKWLEQRFHKELEKLKHEQSKEIEGIRQKVQSLFSRISKIHEREFEVLPRAWFLLHNAHGMAAHLMIKIKNRPDFAAQSDTDFEIFLRESRLSEGEKAGLRAASDRGKYYDDAMFWIAFNDAHTAHNTFHNYLIEHRIFMTDDLREHFTCVERTIGEALVEHRLWKEVGGHEYLRASVNKITHLEDNIAAVERAVQKRLLYDAA